MIKPGVRISGLKAEILLGIVIANEVWKGQKLAAPFMITACVDGRHKSGSLHYAGQAVDIRTHDLAPGERDLYILALRAAAGEDFDALIEDAGTSNEHAHLEYQPKTGVNQ